MSDVIVSLFLLAGGFFTAVAGLGILRLPDVLIRMHASTKAGTLGVGLILTALAIHFAEVAAVTRAFAAVLFLLLTAPVAAHLIGRAAHRIGTPLWDRTSVDELSRDETAAARSGTDQAATGVSEGDRTPDAPRPPP